MQSDRQHLWRVEAVRITFPIEHIERRLAGSRRTGCRVLNPCAVAKRMSLVSSVYGTTRCGYTAPIGAGTDPDLGPVRQIIGVGVRVVQQPAVLHHQAAGVRAVATGIPARAARCRRCRAEWRWPRAMWARLGGLVDLLVADPAQAVAGDLVSQLLEARPRPPDCDARPWRPRRSSAAGGDARTRAAPATVRRASRIHTATPCSCDAWGTPGALTISDRNISDAGSPSSTQLSAPFLVIQHELQRDARAVGPARVRRVTAIADQIARVIVISGTMDRYLNNSAQWRAPCPIHISTLSAPGPSCR